MFSCNDGDFDVPAFEFTETVKSCGEYLLYKTSDGNTEAIALNLAPTDLPTIEGEAEKTLSSSKNVTYRIFDDKIDDNYFCQSIPPLTPQILKELVAEGGTLVITTVAIENNGTDGGGYGFSINSGIYKLMGDRFEHIEKYTFEGGQIKVILSPDKESLIIKLLNCCIVNTFYQQCNNKTILYYQ